ncbi:hypothetical protein V1478_010090 [Vespula squamosa]|uniref:Uncharacterized protein n=1 Tax=Vespula squamosa TaxID=30214 RepID=A0ABD2AIS1_VESSQ
MDNGARCDFEKFTLNVIFMEKSHLIRATLQFRTSLKRSLFVKEVGLLRKHIFGFYFIDVTFNSYFIGQMAFCECARFLSLLALLKCVTCCSKNLSFGRLLCMANLRMADRSPIVVLSDMENYFRPRSHREEVAAFGDPRANADSTLQFANRDAFPLRELQASQPTGDGVEYTDDARNNLFARKYLLPVRFLCKASISDPGPTARRLLHSGTHGLTLTLLYNSRTEMPFRFGSFRLLSPLEMGETPLTEGSTVHSVCFRHLETRPVVSIFRYFKEQNGVLEVPLASV